MEWDGIWGEVGWYRMGCDGQCEGSNGVEWGRHDERSIQNRAAPKRGTAVVFGHIRIFVCLFLGEGRKLYFFLLLQIIPNVFFSSKQGHPLRYKYVRGIISVGEIDPDHSWYCVSLPILYTL